MPSFNSVTIVGNLTRDPEVRYIPNGTSVADAGVAVNRRWKDAEGNPREEVDFFDVTVFGKTADALGQYAKKGDPILFHGRLSQDRWEDKETGNPRSKVKIIAQSMQFLSGPSGGDGGDGQRAQPRPAGNRPPPRRAAGSPVQDHPADHGQPDPDDDVPF